MTRIILDEHDAVQLLRVLYNGEKPARVHTLICVCGAVADLRKSPRAWNGWQILPHAVCPQCVEHQVRESVERYPVRARARFQELVSRLPAEERLVYFTEVTHE